MAAFKIEKFGEEEILVYEGDATNAVEVIDRIIGEKEKKNDDAFMLMNLDTLCNQYQQWIEELPSIIPYYAVKCNPNPVLLHVLANLGVGFDCASKGEIETVLNMRISQDRLIYANPCKAPSSISYAKERGVSTMTFDSVEELDKIIAIYPEVNLILRITADDPSASGAMSQKFGVDPQHEGIFLLEEAKRLGLKVVGISFHVGSGCGNPELFRTAFYHARILIDKGRSMGFNLHIIDIGGGFPGTTEGIPFAQYAKIVRQSINKFFPEKEDVKFISEPGRYFATASSLLVANIIHASERLHTNSNGGTPKSLMRYFINDGIFGVFRAKVTSKRFFFGRPLKEEPDRPQHPSIIWGPTCHGYDSVEDSRVIQKMKVGEWILYENMGAYTSSTSTHFNGFHPPPYFYTIGKSYWKMINDQ